jgi:hypothetical protein
MSLEPRFNLEIPEDAWEQTGMENDPSARLHIGPINVSIAGMPMHLEAFAVDEDCNASDPVFEEEIGAILTLRQGDQPDPLTIRGRDYILVAYPIG